MKFHWQICQIGFILWNFSFCVPNLMGQDAVSELREQLLESQVALEGFQERNRELETQVAEQEAELRQLRSRYAELLVATDQAMDESARLELAAAHLIGQAENPGASTSGPAVELLDTLALTQQRLLELEQALQSHGKSMRAVLDACQPSQALRQAVSDSLQELDGKLGACLSSVTLATSPQPDSSQLSAAVIKVDRATRLAVLDQGFLNGVCTGMTFVSRRDGGVAIRLKVLEVRALCCAAGLEQGDFKTLLPGTLLQREMSGVEAPRESGK